MTKNRKSDRNKVTRVRLEFVQKTYVLKKEGKRLWYSKEDIHIIHELMKRGSLEMMDFSQSFTCGVHHIFSDAMLLFCAYTPKDMPKSTPNSANEALQIARDQSHCCCPKDIGFDFLPLYDQVCRQFGGKTCDIPESAQPILSHIRAMDTQKAKPPNSVNDLLMLFWTKSHLSQWPMNGMPLIPAFGAQPVSHPQSQAQLQSLSNGTKSQTKRRSKNLATKGKLLRLCHLRKSTITERVDLTFRAGIDQIPISRKTVDSHARVIIEQWDNHDFWINFEDKNLNTWLGE